MRKSFRGQLCLTVDTVEDFKNTYLYAKRIPDRDSPSDLIFLPAAIATLPAAVFGQRGCEILTVKTKRTRRRD